MQKEEHRAEMYACMFMDDYSRTGQAQVPRIARAFCGLLEGHGNSICSILTEGKQ